ncbi:MAG: DUF350 domain-containing protein [Bacteroidia bacterium]
MVLFAFLYVKLTPYSVHDEIEKDNVAAGLGFAGGLISIGIIVMKGVSDFGKLEPGSYSFGTGCRTGVCVPDRCAFCFDKLVLRNSDLEYRNCQ